MKNIFDVAELAGVSKSTVSRVINNKGSVKDSTRIKIENAMKELNYSPSFLAQGIRTGKTKTLALMVSESSNLYYNELLYRIEEIALQNEYMVMLCNCGTDPNRTLKYIHWVLQRNVDGIIYCFYRDSIASDELYHLSNEIPIVFVDNPLNNRSNISCVGADGLQDVAEIVRFFKEKGAKNIGFIGISDICNITYRYMGYRAGLTACGYDPDPDLVYMVDFQDVGKYSHFALGYNAAKTLMSKEKKPDAIVASTDMLAIGAQRYFLEAGYSIPQDIMITGYDDILLSSMVTPGISTMAQPVAQISREIISILLQKIQKDNHFNKSVLLKSKFIQRGST